MIVPSEDVISEWVVLTDNLSSPIFIDSGDLDRLKSVIRN